MGTGAARKDFKTELEDNFVHVFFYKVSEVVALVFRRWAVDLVLRRWAVAAPSPRIRYMATSYHCRSTSSAFCITGGGIILTRHRVTLSAPAHRPQLIFSCSAHESRRRANQRTAGKDSPSHLGFSVSLSHQIFGHMHRVINIDKK